MELKNYILPIIMGMGCLLSITTLAMDENDTYWLEDSDETEVQNEQHLDEDQKNIEKFTAPYIMIRREKKILRREKRKPQGTESVPEKKIHIREDPCWYCGTYEAVQWREGPKKNGPNGPGRSPSKLCNPCGLRYRQNKEAEIKIPPKTPHKIAIEDLLD